MECLDLGDGQAIQVQIFWGYEPPTLGLAAQDFTGDTTGVVLSIEQVVWLHRATRAFLNTCHVNGHGKEIYGTDPAQS